MVHKSFWINLSGILTQLLPLHGLWARFLRKKERKKPLFWMSKSRTKRLEKKKSRKRLLKSVDIGWRIDQTIHRFLSGLNRRNKDWNCFWTETLSSRDAPWKNPTERYETFGEILIGWALSMFDLRVKLLVLCLEPCVVGAIILYTTDEQVTNGLVSG